MESIEAIIKATEVNKGSTECPNVYGTTMFFILIKPSNHNKFVIIANST